MDTSVKQIKGYEIRERIGAGGFGAVHKGYQSTIGREVAIKIILPGRANQPDFIRRFESEAQLVARLEHPHIVPLYDFWRDPDGAYLVMRWLRGGSLKDALEKGAFEPLAAALLVDQIAGALAFAHRSGIIHRDIKPGNILLDEDGNAYLTDFGIAKDLNLSNDLTQSGAILGSMDYISPEQARSEAVTVRTDIYSLGVTVYELLTGHHPFQNISPIERLYKHINDPLPDITTLEANLNDTVNRIIQKATAKNPNHRYPDVLAFAAEFREAVGMNSITASAVEGLTLREQEILGLIVDGLANKEIAQRLTLTIGTVKWHVNQIYGKLGVRSRVQAIVRARELQLITRPGDNPSTVVVRPDDTHLINPYKGLLSFQSADYQDFFGREKVTAKLIKRLSESSDYSRFLAIVGPSGSGKSSVAKAGLIPALWRGSIPKSERWFIAEMMPGAHPLDELEVALTRVAANQSAHLNEQLQRDKRGLVRAAGLILPNDGTEIILVIDQFEEVFTLTADEAERAQFLDLLYAAVTEPRSRVRLVITLRADFYDRPLHYPQFGELVRNRLETLMPLSAEEIEQAIVGPAERVGVSFEQGLVTTIIGDVNYQPGALPLLQYALTELFEHRQGRVLTRAAYEGIGGTVKALTNRAEEIYSKLTSVETELTRQVFLRLVTLGDGVEYTRRRVSRSELKSLIDDIDTLEEILDSFAGYRLFSLDTDPGTRTPTVEIAHEALLHEWERLRAWLIESRDDIKTQRLLAQMAAEWRAAGSDTSFLARGLRLSAFEVWAKEAKIILNAPERAFLDASVAHREAEQNVELERKAREQSLERRTQTFLRGLVAVLLLAVLISGGFALLAFNRETEAQEARLQAVNAQATSEANFARAEQQRLYLAADQAMNNNAPGNVAMALASRSLAYGYTHGADAALMRATRQGVILRTLTGHQFEISSVAISPDSALAALSGEGGTRVYDTANGQELHFLPEQSFVSSIQFSSSGDQLLTASQGGQVQVWEISNGTLKQTFSIGTDVFAVDFLPEQTQFIARTRRNYQVWDMLTGTRLETYPASDFGRPGLATVAMTQQHGLLMGMQDAENRFFLQNPQTGEVTCTLLEAGDVRFRKLWSSVDQPFGVMVTDDNVVQSWNLNTCVPLVRFSGHANSVNALDYDPNREVVVTGDDSGLAIQWDIYTGRELARYHTTNWILTLDISSDGTKLLMPQWNTASIWDFTFPQEPRQIITDQFDGTHFPHFSPDGEYLYVGGYGVYSRWSLNGNPRQPLITYDQPIKVMDISSDGRYIFGPLETDSNSNLLIDAETGETIRVFTGHTSAVNWGDISPDGTRVVSGSFDLTARVWDMATAAPVHVLRGHTGVVSSAMFSPDGTLIVTTSSDGTLRFWDAVSAEVVRSVTIDAPLPFADFSPDGTRVVTVDTNGLGYLVDVASGDILHTLRGHTDTGWTAKFSPDGKLVVTANWDGTARIWDVETGTLVRTLIDGNSTAIYWAEFSPDGRTIATGGERDNRVYLWRLDPEDVIVDYCARNPLELTHEQRVQYGITDDEPVC